MTHTSAAEMAEDTFPHGTKDGYNLGCKGAACPAGAAHGLSCRRANSLQAGDYQYQKLVRTGATPREIADALGLHPEISAAPSQYTHEKQVAPKQEPIPATVPEKPAKWAVRHVWVAFAPDGTMHGPFDDHGEAIGYVGEQLRPPAPKPKATPKRPMSTEEIAKIRELHAEGLTDTAIGKKLGRAQAVISSWRRRLGLPANGKQVARDAS